MKTPTLAMPRVLIVDDESRSLDAIRRTLEEDFEVLTAPSADEARSLKECLVGVTE